MTLSTYKLRKLYVIILYFIFTLYLLYIVYILYLQNAIYNNYLFKEYLNCILNSIKQNY